MTGLNIYSIANGDYYTYVLVIASSEEEAVGLAIEVYKKDDRTYNNLFIDVVIENITGPTASEVCEG